ncbi:MBL fold metallo-hydrolase [Agromyces humatus]|uniref:MBL fold metallo-hydrolase n=1 Tax=Agromyces humatus TaxID=279573 RepID=A0ABP4WPH5_9MICO
MTGSKTLIELDSTRILVDCGLFQGYKVLRERNRTPFPVDPESIDAVVLTHAHLDHSGYVPALVRDGFRGPVYTTPGTAELCGVVLPDSGYLLEEEARHASSGRWSSHRNPTPLYTAADATRSLDRFRPIGFDTTHEIARGLEFTFVPAGHILGAAGVRVSVGGRVVHFSGDLGRASDPLMRPPRPLEPATVLVTESTYGDRLHADEDPEAVFGEVVRRVAKKNGVVLIPAFAVGRTETILLHLSRLRDRGELPDIPIYLNSPMAINVAAIYERYPEEHRLDAREIERMYDLATSVHTVDDSKLLNLRGGPMIIISASGMLAGGRILHHLVAYGSDRHNAIVLTGYQAGGTRGSALLGGARSLRIFGRDVPIRAEVVAMDSLSAHADADELLAWMGAVDRPPEAVYVTHGEPAAADTLRARIKRELHWPVHVPEHLQRVGLGAHQATVSAPPPRR